jgi:hypothetical protein
LRGRKQKIFVKRWEDNILNYLSNGEKPEDVLNDLPHTSYKYLMLHLRNYLITLKGKERIKLSSLINETKLYNYLFEQLNSGIKKQIVFGAYYLGLSKSIKAKYVLRDKLKHRNYIIFLSCALSLARMNDVDSFDVILSEAKKFRHLSRDTILNIILEFENSVCEKLLKRLDEEESIVFKSVIISALRHFKYSPAASDILLNLLKEESNDIIIESVKYFSDIEYINAATAIKFLLLNNRAEIRAEAIRAAVKVGSPSLEERIWSLLWDKDRNVKVLAAEAMYGFSGNSKEKLKELAYTMPNTVESSVARMIISEKTIHLN